MKTVVIFAFLMVMTLFMIWAERRVVARMQQRLGPNRVGPFGLLQGLADGIKLALKEDLIPTAADKIVFIIAPIISAIPAFMAFGVIPFGPTVSIFGKHTDLQLSDLPVAVLFILAMSSMGVYGIVLAGWSSGSTYPLLGGVRSAAQIISYEVAMGLSFVGVFIQSGSLSTSDIVDAQAHIWFVLSAFVAFAVYAVSMVGETNRAPFDLPEAEGELVGGFHTEYTSLKFALFFLAEYINMVTVSALMTTLFLGGWRAPYGVDLGVARRQHRLVADAVVLRQAVRRPVRLHLAARHVAAAALRPVHEARLEGPDPGQLDLDHGRSDDQGAQPQAGDLRHRRGCRSSWSSGSFVYDSAQQKKQRRARCAVTGRRECAVRSLRRRLPRATDAWPAPAVAPSGLCRIGQLAGDPAC